MLIVIGQSTDEAARARSAFTPKTQKTVRNELAANLLIEATRKAISE